MKKLFYFLSLFIAAVTINSCDTEPLDPNLIGNNPSTGPASFEVDFSGSTYQTTVSSAVIANGTITLTATRSSDNATFVIVVPGTSTGVYNNAVLTYSPNPSAAGVYSNTGTTGINGSVHITSINTSAHKITGTFNFTGYWSDTTANLPSINFTDGVFANIDYTGDGVTTPTEDPLFQVKIDGVLYTADSYEATVGGGLIGIGGFRGTNGEYVGIAIEGLTVGTYNDALLAYSPDGDEDNVYSNISLESDNDGVVEITEIDEVNHTISGTFSFTGYHNATSASKTFTEGVFTNIPYTTENTTDDEFSATVDGTNYEYAGTDLVVSTVNDNQITLQAINANHEVRLYIGETATVGNYPFSSEIGSPAKAWFEDAAGTEYTINNGVLNITYRDETSVSGTFSYDVLDEEGTVIHTVTNGEFDVEYN